MRAQNPQNARQPACDHRRVLGGRSLGQLVEQTSTWKMSKTTQTTIQSPDLPHFPVKNAQTCCKIYILFFLKVQPLKPAQINE